MSTAIPHDQFQRMVELMPLISVDLVLKNSKNQVLLGMRNNRPAQGYWFVPGGRIFKDERIYSALSRVALKELNKDIANIENNTVQFLGVYEHLYDDAFFGDQGVSTHYVVLGFQVSVANDFELSQHDDQHANLRWWDIEALIASEDVHQYTKNYFLNKELK